MIRTFARGSLCRLHGVAVSVAFALFPMLSNAQAQGVKPIACEQMTSVKLPGFDMNLKKAVSIPAGPIPQAPGQPPISGQLPAYCRVDGALDERVVNGKPYAIGFAVSLPENWNGRFLFQGGGGLNGSVAAPIGPTAAGATPALSRGFAVVTTDSGHTGAVFDSSFFQDQEATLNFLYQAIGKVTQVAKSLVAARYGKPADHSYFVGCSTGGREAMMMSQRYPRYFDGIVAGSPAMRTSFSNLADKWVTVALNQVAPRDEKGHPVTAKALSDGDKHLIVDSVLKACDAKDGIKDGMIFDPRGCGFDPATLTCKGPKTDSCLTAKQVTAVKRGFAGPKDFRGNPVYTGWWYDTGIAATGFIPGLLNPGPSPIGAPVTATEMHVDREAREAANQISAVGDSAHWTQLNSFSGHGGKLIFFHGVSDPWFSARDTVRYYEEMSAENGGAATVSNWSRLFLVPGMGHCGGGPATLDRFDLLEPLVNWVENGKAPDSVEATGASFPGRSRPLCPYPQHAQYKGSGDTEKAENFLCKKD